MKMATISQTKNRLSALLNAVRRGETILILDRDRPIARLEPVEPAGLDQTQRLATLERDGLLRRARKPLSAERLPAAPPGGSQASILDALLAERDEGR